jgi:uncharacterized protein
MTKRILFVQGGGKGAYDADALLAANLGSNLGPEYEIRYPAMPNEAAPDYSAWKQRISEELAGFTSDDFIVSHSLGASILLKALADGMECPVKTAFLVSTPYWGGEGWTQWPEVALSEEEVVRLSEGLALYFYHSSDDDVVPGAHLDLYAKAFPQSTVRRVEGLNHQLDNDLSEIATDISGLG